MIRDSNDYASPKLSVAITRASRLRFAAIFTRGSITPGSAFARCLNILMSVLYREYPIEWRNRAVCNAIPVAQLELVKQTVKRRAAVNAFPFSLNSSRCRVRDADTRLSKGRRDICGYP